LVDPGQAADRGTDAPIGASGPRTFELTGGEAHEVNGCEAPTKHHDVYPDRLLGNKACDSDKIRDDLAKRGITPVIPPRSNRQRSAMIARLPSPEQAKPGPVPADNRLWLNDQQGVQNVGYDPIEARKNETIKIVEDDPFRRFSLQHIELVAEHKDLRLERGARAEEPDENAPNQFEQIPHKSGASPDSRLYAKGIELSIGTTRNALISERSHKTFVK